MINLSIDGAAIETTKRLGIDREYVIKMNHKGMVLNVRGRTVWCTLTRCVKKERGDVVLIYRAGFLFREGLNENLKDILNACCFSPVTFQFPKLTKEIRKSTGMRKQLVDDIRLP